MGSQQIWTLFYVFLPTFVVVISLIKLRTRSSNQSRRRLPPGPPGLPLLGNFHQLRLPLHETFHQLATAYGDLVFLQLGSVPTLIVSSGDIAREICKSHDIAFSGRPVLHVPWKVTYNGLGMVFATYGEYWREVRKIATLELLSVKRVQSFQGIRKEEVANLINSIAGSSRRGPVNLTELIHVLSNSVICRVAFGTKFHRGGSEAGGRGPKDMLLELQSLLATICVSDFFPWMGWTNKVNGLDGRLDKNFRELDKLYNGILEEHRDPERPNRQAHEDLVDVLVRFQKNSDHRLLDLSDDFIKALVADMFVAGTDTSAATLVWAMTELIRNPLVMERAQEEVRRVVEGKETVEEIHLKDLVYIKSIVKETLRLRPATPLLLPRVTVEPCEIRGYQIPARTRVFINARAMGLDPKSWEDPYRFLPDRFLDSSADFRAQNFEFIPFGFGRRMCPGMNFATVLIELVLANLLYHFNWEFPEGVTAENINMEEALGFTVHKKTPLYLMVNQPTRKVI